VTEYKPGQTVWLSPNGNYARIYKHLELPVEAQVESVKRKYFYVRKGDNRNDLIKFDKETGENVSEDCNASWTVWPSRQDYLDAREHDDKIQAIQAAMRSYRVGGLLTLDHVRRIHDVLLDAGAIKVQ